MQATAAVFHEPQRPLELRTVPLPQLSAGQVLVEVDCCTICGSDLHSISGARTVPVPSILGHEILGRVVETAGDIRDVSGDLIQPGDRIVWSVAASCGRCFFCTEGPPQKCEDLFKYGHARLTDEHPLSGGLATHCHLKAGTAIVRVPDELSDRVASPASCATATVAAALRTSGLREQQTVVIHGAGMLGLTAAAMARTRGAAHVIVTDLDPQRAKRAAGFGATHDSIDCVAELTDGRGADVVLDMSGAPAAMESAVDQLRTGGRLILVGAVFPARPLALAADVLVRKMLRVEGVHNYEPQDLHSAVRFLAESGGRYPFASLVDCEFPLRDIDRAIASAKQAAAFRVAIRPQMESGN